MNGQRNTHAQRTWLVAFAAVCVGLTALVGQSASQGTGPSASPGSAEYKNRFHLPMPNTARANLITYDAKSPDTKFPPIEQLRPPKGAPNVLIVLIDDAGFGASSAFGGPCQTPTLDKLAKNGLKYNRFHTDRKSTRLNSSH